MANEEHVRKLLSEGVEKWIMWRVENPAVRIDLRNAQLTDADLHCTDFINADLRNASLHGADLRGALLDNADLGGADLGEADLRDTKVHGACLGRADLFAADLRGASLLGADLSRANLSHADLRYADLDHATLFETTFANVNLSTVHGLTTCNHRGASIVDYRTLARSGPLPLAFLRGCGLPDALIDYLPALRQEPFQFYSCFISYASRDQAFAERLYADLQNEGVRCWFAPEDMKIGARLRPRIDETIRVYDKLLLVLSKTSVASQWVEQEVETAFEREHQQGNTVLFPLRIDNTVMTWQTGWPALIRRTRHIGDFRGWETHGTYQHALAQLQQDLTAAQKPNGGKSL
jgi:uncharacterized protein YjbI with pentapeptide repeats